MMHMGYCLLIGEQAQALICALQALICIIFFSLQGFFISISFISLFVYIYYLLVELCLVYYCKCCNLIGYSTRYLFLNW